MSAVALYDIVEPFAALGLRAFTTTRAAGNFALLSNEPAGEVMARWRMLRLDVAGVHGRLATSVQVHGTQVVQHEPGWRGWLRVDDADGHIALSGDTAMAVTVADCVPVFIGHPSRACAVLHSGWRGTAAGILARGIELLKQAGLPPNELHVHLGPAICGKCYVVSPDVYAQLTGETPSAPKTVDLRGILTAQAARAGVQQISSSRLCTRCDNEIFFSHRAGDVGRQIGVITLV